MNLSRYFVFALLTILVFSCESDPTFDDDSNQPNTPNTTVDVPDDLDAEYVTLLQLVNDLRAAGCQCGDEFKPPVNAVSWNILLAQAALRHSQDMDQNDHFNHTGTDGSDPGQRITATGYNWRTYGENIAWRFFDAQSVFEGWKSSPGHCKNMMNGNFTEMGAARVNEYYTQDFGAQR